MKLPFCSITALLSCIQNSVDIAYKIYSFLSANSTNHSTSFQLDAPLLPYGPPRESPRESRSQDLRVRQDGEACIPVSIGIGPAFREKRGDGERRFHV